MTSPLARDSDGQTGSSRIQPMTEPAGAPHTPARTSGMGALGDSNH